MAVTVQSTTTVEGCTASTEVCMTSIEGTGGNFGYIIDPQTLDLIGWDAQDAGEGGVQDCVQLALPCPGVWVIEVYAIMGDAGNVLISSIDVDCVCEQEPLVISGFTQCRSGGLLGDGSDLRVLLVTKGAQSVLAEMKPTSGQFTRALDTTSELTMTGIVSGRLGDLCCDGWEDIRTWATEILVYRDGRDAWCGPVTDVSFEYGTIRVDADDITAWWDRRTIPDLIFTNEDLTDIFLAINEAAMEPDPSPLIAITSTPTGVAGSRRYVGANYQYAGDAIDELAKTGLDYTAYGRTVIVGGQEISADPYVTLLDEHWTSPPKIRQRGNDQATVVVVKYKGGQAIATADAEYLNYYGRIVRVFDEATIVDDASAQLAAQTRLDMLKDAFFIETPTGAGLKTTAPITLEQLIPGMRLRVDSQATCRQVVNDFRLHKVTVDFNGNVAIDLQPLGNTTDAGDVVLTA